MNQEVYALGSDRSAAFVRGFLERFVGECKVFAAEFGVPQYSDKPEHVFRSEKDILDFLEAHPCESYSLYWNARSPDEVSQAMVFFTKDRQAIFGLAVEANIDEWQKALIGFLGTTITMLGSEQPPPETAAEFIRLCRR
jgi:hypothetical protein